MLDVFIVVFEVGYIVEGVLGCNFGFMIDLLYDLIFDDYVGSGDDKVMIWLNCMVIFFVCEVVVDY